MRSFLHKFSLFYLFSLSFCLKVLIINPAYGRSHVNFIDSISNALVEKGHIVDMIVIDIELSTKKFKSKMARRQINIPNIEENIYNMAEFGHNPFNASSGDGVEMTTISMRQTSKDVVHFLDSHLSELKNEVYDLAIIQLTGYYPAAIIHLLGIKVFAIASACPLGPHITTLFGIPSPASFVANPYIDLIPMYGKSMNWMERSMNLFTSAYQFYFMDRIAEDTREIFKVLDPEIPDLKEVSRRAALLLTNTHPLLDNVRPLSNRILHIGGIEVRQRIEEKIPKEIQSILSSHSKIILISFGSFVKTEYVTKEIIDCFIEAFSSFPEYQFLFKFDSNDSIIEGRSSNIHFFEWLPQTALLGSGRVRAFISHTGGNSLAEAAHLGVPLIAIPLFSDQYYNTASATKQGIAYYVDKRNITTLNLIQALKEVLQENSSYTRNSQRLQRELSNFPDDLRERMVKYLAFIAINGRQSVWDSEGAEMGLMTYYSYDIILSLLFFFILFIYLLLRVIYCIFYCFKGWMRKEKFE